MPPKPPPPTHFLCIPLSGPQLSRSLSSFKADVSGVGASSKRSTVIPEQAVRPPGTLHLTLGVMSLREPGAISRAITVLQSMRLRDILDKASAQQEGGDKEGEERPPLSLTMRGLEAMRRASATTVLYVPPVDRGGVLRRFCELLRQSFLDAGVMADDRRPLLLHATVVNTIYVKKQQQQQQDDGQRRRQSRQRLELDARDLIARYKDYVWAEELSVRTVAICRMGAIKVEGSDGDQAYEVEGEIHFD
ncbi:activating signal cointegrator complex subunit 1 [Geosmithia morbida]|uniref:Activating signal cointegrator complex subunit 1 n=1 Tax=Geosmithia morbida TaxID=1094350 RepID=A0A9P4YVA8_9HYPO|nr:activating signal cointegrator complex subunit 1 [Geosmithia morbida]KAF4121649.1 activating signal cointegrator complex subunit 1 [Geosmithia morbida]